MFAVLIDYTVQIAMLIMFKIPLNKLKLQDLEEKHGDAATKKTQKLLFFGSKIFVLVATSLVSSLIASVIFGAVGRPSPPTADNILNGMVLMLMSPYYTGAQPKLPFGKDNGNEYWYRILCRCCIVICCQS